MPRAKSQQNALLSEERCPVCGGPTSPHDVVDFNKSCIETGGRRLVMSGVPVYYRLCGVCGFCYAPEFRRWSRQDFEKKIYNARYVEVDPDYMKARPAANARFLRQLFEHSKDLIDHLDYGGGNGVLSRELETAGWRSQSFDPFEDAKPRRGELGRFNLISAFEVFEHVPDVEQLANNLAKLLKPEGIVILSTLTSDEFIAANRRLDWWYAAPRNGHVSLFTRRSLNSLAARVGLQCRNLSSLIHVFFRALPSWAEAPLKTFADASSESVKRQRLAQQPKAGVELDPAGFNALRMARTGPMLYNKNDIYIGKALAKYGESCWFEHEFFKQVVRPGFLVVEAGANIGTHTVGLSRLVGSGGAVFAFEPQRIVFQNLCANLALNQCANVHAFNEAIGAEAGEIAVPAVDPKATNNFGGLSLIGASRGEKVRMRTLDSLLLPACHLLKADVEGMEVEVLRGSVETIRRFRPVLYVENDRQERSSELLKFIFDLGYNAYWHLPPLFNPKNFAADPENIYPGIVSVNVLCLPSEANITVQQMKRITSPSDTWKA